MPAEKEFNVGQKAFLRPHGLGFIENIESIEMGGLKEEFYIVSIPSTKLTHKIPVRKANQFIRSVMSPREVEKIYEVLDSPAAKKSTISWNRRFKNLNEKMLTGNPYDIAEVLRDLAGLRGSKDLSFGEKNMLDRARDIIVTEICAAKGQDRSVVEGELNRILLKM